MSDKEKISQWMMEHGYATGHGTSVDDFLQELEWQVAEREREACAKVAESYEPRCDLCPGGVATAIRARGIDGVTVGEVGVWGEHEPLYMDMSKIPTEMPDWKPGMVFPNPKREWVGLTDDEIWQVHKTYDLMQYKSRARAIESKLKEKNT